MTEDYLTVAEVAEMWRVSDKTVRRALWAGDLPYIRLGSNKRTRIRVRRSAADQYMKSRERTAA